MTAVLHGSYNLEKVLNFGSRLEKSFNLVKVHMTPIFFRYGGKISCLKYTILKFEMFWIKAEDFMRA